MNIAKKISLKLFIIKQKKLYFMSYLSELAFLAKALFKTKPQDINELQLKSMVYFPFDGFKAMSFCGYMIVKSRYINKIKDYDINHETIHLMQAKDEGSWIKYYLKYIWDYLKAKPFFNPFSYAYETTIYELEAYAKEYDFEYIKRREPLAINKFKIENRFEWWKKYRNVFRDNVKEYFKDI